MSKQLLRLRQKTGHGKDGSLKTAQIGKVSPVFGAFPVALFIF